MYNNSDFLNDIPYDKRIFIINGTGGVGKDTFVKIVNSYIPSSNYSSVHQIKHVASLLGWNGEKDNKSRRFLSDLKILSSNYNDYPYLDIIERIHHFIFSMYETDEILFIHIREPEEICRVVDFCESNNIKVDTILVTNYKPSYFGNEADDNIYQFNYDYIVDNSGSLSDLCEEAEKFFNFFKIDFK